LEEGQPLNFENLRNYGKENRLDFSAYFQPPKGALNTIFSRLFPSLLNPGIRAGHVKDRDKRNDLVLRTLLSNSQAAIKLGLDLRGGIAFTMEARDLNVSSDGTDPSGATAMDKVVEIMNERLNAFGVAETVVQKKGDRAIEIKIPDRTTKQNPGMIENLQKPAKLEFRIVNNDSSVRQPSEENQDWTSDEGILYRSMTTTDAEPNEPPIWVR
jgi:SecD/SecF fusion protein